MKYLQEQAEEITAELSKLNDAILHDKPINIEDLEDLSKVAKGTKIDIGGEVMTIEEAENNPDLKMNIEIWKEMKEGNFENTHKLTRITPSVSKYLENVKGDLNLNNLTSAKGLILPATVEGDLYLRNITSAEDLTLPTTVNGSLYLKSLISAEGLTLPNTIKGNLWLNSLTSAKDLILLTNINGNISLRGLTSIDKEELKKKYPHINIYN